MEEILASIRRIIADDQETMQGGPSVPPTSSSPLRTVLDLAERQHAPSAAPTAVNDGDDVLEGIEAAFPPGAEGRQRASASPGARYRIEQYPPAAIPASEPETTTVAEPSPATLSAPQPRPTERPSSAPLAESVEEALLSSEADASIFDAFARLGASVPASAPKTLEDIVKEMLRPMLKAWLDDNLPALVERLVQAEIERVTRGKR